MVIIRPLLPSEYGAAAALFRRSVLEAAAGQYAAAARRAWAAGADDPDAWAASFHGRLVLAAELDGQLAGFADGDTAGGYLDRLYVRPDCLRRGAATALCSALEAAMETDTVRVDASITARPFFEGRGYRVLRQQQVVRRGVTLTNFAMEKTLCR